MTELREHRLMWRKCFCFFVILYNERLSDFYIIPYRDSLQKAVNSQYISTKSNICLVVTDKSVNKGHTKEKLTWSLKTSGLYLEITLFYFNKEELFKYRLYLQGDLYIFGGCH